jgi:phasin family protein
MAAPKKTTAKAAAPKAVVAKKPVKTLTETTVKTPVEVAAEAGKETVEAVVKASTEAAAEVAAGAVAATKEHVEKTSKAVSKGYGDFAALGKENVEAVIRSGSIMVKGFEILGREVAAYTRQALEGNVATTQAVLGAKSLNEAVELQNDYARKSFDQFMAESAKLTELSVKVANEAAAPIQARVNVTVEKLIKPAA